MADLYDPPPSSSPPPPPHTATFTLESDDISSLLHNLLHKSSQPSSSISAHLHDHHQPPPVPENRRQFPGSAVFSEPADLPDSSPGLNFPFLGAYCSSGFSERTDNAFSVSMALSMEGIGEVDCESDEQQEAPVNPAPERRSSKRSRAAEVHNLSEKRRRQRINEKMKALQKLIPNSNKTDKASMLDEAIEYLKQLQLQVQMLTMRNGSSLHPFCLPGIAQSVPSTQVLPLPDASNTARLGSFPANREASMHTLFDLCSKPPSSDYKVPMPFMQESNASEPSFVLEPSPNAHYRPVTEPMLSKVLCKDPTLPELQLDMSHCGQSTSSGLSS